LESELNIPLTYQENAVRIDRPTGAVSHMHPVSTASIPLSKACQWKGSQTNLGDGAIYSYILLGHEVMPRGRRGTLSHCLYGEKP
jgi:hypothetical protein